MTVFPSITPTCWTAISSGSVPSVNGALCHQVHIDGTFPTNYVTPYHSSNIYVERFWEAAAKIGKRSLILDVPSSAPAKCDGVLQVLGGVTITPDACPAETYISGIPQHFFTNENLAKTVDMVKTKAGGAWTKIEGESSYNILSRGVYSFSPIYADKRYRIEEVEEHKWIIVTESDGVRIGTDETEAKNAPIIKLGEWSDVITRRLLTSDGVRVPFHFRVSSAKAYASVSEHFTLTVSANPLTSRKSKHARYKSCTSALFLLV